MKILVVDDDIDSRVFLERALLQQGYITEIASNGVVALEKIKLSPPDMIISDILMPEMDGFELCRRVKTDENLRHIPLVFYTATYVDEKDEKLAMSLGASRFLIKPMELDDLLITIKDVIQKHLAHELQVPEQPLKDLAELDRMQFEATKRKLDKKMRELEKEHHALQQAQLEWENIFQAIGNPTIILDSQHNILSANRAAVQAVSASLEKDLIGRKCYEIFHNASNPPESCPLVKLLTTEKLEEAEMEVETLGRIYHVSCNPVFDILNEERNIKKIIHIATDITDIKRAEDALRMNQALLFHAMKITSLGYWEYDVATDMFKFNDNFYAIFRTTADQVGGYLMSSADCANRFIHPEDKDIFTAEIHSAIETDDPNFNRQIEHRIFFADGEVGYIAVNYFIVKDEKGKTIKTYGINQDITERKRAEKALQESEESYRRLFQDHAAVKLLIDPDTGNIVDANKSAVNFYGWSEAELKKMKIEDINTLPPQQVKAEMEKARTLKRTYFDFSHRLKDGSIKNVRVFSSGINLKGKDYIHSIVHDVTKEKELEAQLFQSQKLESIGNLASGIAHDFNNMLNIILGYSELLLNKLHQGDLLRENVKQIVEAANRSMSLTQQLLAFSRKQILRPKILNINETLKSIQNMLQRLIGENIELVMSLDEDIHNVEVDPVQIDQVIINLATNARDAMPFGGKLILETANVLLDEQYIQNHPEVTSGEYVMIAVTDTGYGMDKETLSRIFEPFFTTKGKGTGLGLATIYGIVKQSGGHIWVYSEQGKGTTFKIYLPAVFIESQVQPQEKQIDRIELKGRGGHILVVEDEPALRGLFEAMLTNLGYRTTLAANGEEAVLLVEEKGLKPDLIITDVIMPIMSGAMLVERLKKTHPHIKVLYMSGYTDDAIVHHGVLDKGIPFIQKPFTINDLASKIEKLLGTQPSQ